MPSPSSPPSPPAHISTVENKHGHVVLPGLSFPAQALLSFYRQRTLARSSSNRSTSSEIKNMHIARYLPGPKICGRRTDYPTPATRKRYFFFFFYRRHVTQYLFRRIPSKAAGDTIRSSSIRWIRSVSGAIKSIFRSNGSHNSIGITRKITHIYYPRRV